MNDNDFVIPHTPAAISQKIMDIAARWHDAYYTSDDSIYPGQAYQAFHANALNDVEVLLNFIMQLGTHPAVVLGTERLAELKMVERTVRHLLADLDNGGEYFDVYLANLRERVGMARANPTKEQQ